jgi:hypothetical protein
MVKYILIMVICSGIPGNECKPMPTPLYKFNEYHKCIIYGYDYSSELLKSLDSNFVDEHKAYTTFDCKENTSI